MTGLLKTANCSLNATGAPSDAGVAGAGILLSFMITAGLAIILSSSVIFAEFLGKSSTIRRKLLNGYSDSQLIQGIGIQSIGLAKMNTLIPYHFFLIWMMSLLSMATHNATLLALVHDYRRDWVLRWMRQFLMFVNLALSCVSGAFVLQTVSKGLENRPIPIACVWEANDQHRGSNTGLSYFGTIAIITGNCVIFVLATWYLHNQQQKFYRAVQIVGMLVMTIIAVGAGVRIILLSQAFGTPSVPLIDDGEKNWSFGQLLSMLLLILPLVSVVEIYRGEIDVAPPVADERQRIYDGEVQSKGYKNEAYELTPSTGSEASLFKKR